MSAQSPESVGPRAARAGVVGSPVEHSLSPVLHGAAYAALGLRDWSYQRVERDAEGLRELVGELGPDWRGLSVTMPGKHAALELASESSERAVAVGAANTLVRCSEGGWYADCTDVDGVSGALRGAGGFRGGAPGAGTGLVLGAGGTALAVLAAFAELEVRTVTLAVRDPARAGAALATAERVGVRAEARALGSLDLAEAAAAADVVVSTLPAGAVDGYAHELAKAGCVLDVVYHPWPTPLAEAVHAVGGRLATGLDMLLHQSFGQVELFTGVSAPRAAMRDALSEATGGGVPLPLR
ncbi:shikimate dehydrogenase [Actinopolyspora xinjiangensis]|uniref:Shikimate dehydrogenase n=1 Tax=Actinopolyspora xinjiangensis TaxID=405564 RepID=A0A1H0TU53_9ACTN|nr:shikimate dehydrogenase [Actinopolyspora xinjiangensis]SDP57188.1 shikimate dehydrogenase [Actinopolyspora xinjiangensis]